MTRRERRRGLKAEATRQAVLYIRVSTSEQAIEGLSLEAQRAKAEAWCALNGYVLSGVFEDAGRSGKSLNGRPGLEAALTQVEVVVS